MSSLLLSNTSNISNSSSCEYCGKSYIRKSSYERHYAICEITHKSKRLRICDEQESTDIPTISQLYIVIQEMALRQQKMEEKMEEMQKWIDRKKKKMDIIHWLNNQPQTKIMSILFIDRIKSFTVCEDDIMIILEQNIIETIINILKKNLKPPEDNGKIKEPIACFMEKSNVFYIYKSISVVDPIYLVDIVDTNKKSDMSDKYMNNWIKMIPEDFVYMLKLIHSKLLNEICAWRDRNHDKIRYNDKMSEMYNKMVIKLMSMDFSQESTLAKIKIALYTFLKGDLKNMVEYDFEF